MVEGRRAIDGFIAQGWIPQSYVLAEAKIASSDWPEALMYRLSNRLGQRLRRLLIHPASLPCSPCLR